MCLSKGRDQILPGIVSCSSPALPIKPLRRNQLIRPSDLSVGKSFWCFKLTLGSETYSQGGRTAKVEVQPRPSDVFKELVLYDDFHYSSRPIIFLKRML